MNTANAFPFFSSPCCVTHDLTPHDRALMAQMRPLIEPGKGKLRGTAARQVFDAMMLEVAAPEAVSYRQAELGGIAGWWCEPATALADTAILHLHGGWFNWGTATAFRHLVGHIARNANANAFIPDYRLAPEHPFPAAANDVAACFQGLLHLGRRGLAITGDSAGGNLALALLASAPARAASLSGQLRAAAVLSPVSDLTLSAASWESQAAADPLFVRDQAQGLIAAYLSGLDPADPRVSPLFGGFTGLPPLRVHVGNDEVLRDDSMRYVEQAVLAGVDARVDVWMGMIHGFIANAGKLDAADAALRAIGTFLSERLAVAPAST